jgi:hypothetical protein
MSKIYKGLYDNLYKRWELYLFRLFQIARYIEPILKFNRINIPPLEEVLDPKGYNGYVRIPPNPFFLNEGDYKVFKMFMDDIKIPKKEDDKHFRELLKEVWKRINEIKLWLGMSKFTRYKGEKDSNRRLVNEIDLYIKYPLHSDMLYRVVFDIPPEEPKKNSTSEERHKYKLQMEEYELQLKQFKNLLLDRNINGIKSCELYK